MMISLLPVGDRELWYASAVDGSWVLPLFIDWKWYKEEDRHYAMVLPAVGLYYNQHATLKMLFGTHNIIEGRDDQWLITRKMCEAILHKAPGITPLCYYKWNEPNHPALPITAPEKVSVKEPDVRSNQGSSDYEAFVAHLCRVNGLPNSIVRIVLRALGDAAPEWMLEHRKPLDLGFCKLLAVPFRPNWKEIVGFKVRKSKLLGLFNKSSKERYQALEEADLPAVLCSVHNIGMVGNYSKKHGRRRLEYTIEAVPNEKFEKAANNVEHKRQACGSISYVGSYERTVENLYYHLLDALENYLRKIGAPFARISECSLSGFLKFVPTNAQKVRIRGVAVNNLPVNIIEARSAFSAVHGEDNQTLLREADVKVQKVPNLLQEKNDVRRCDEHGELDQPGNGST